MINMIVIHCSDSPDDRHVTAADIHRWHLDRGWSGIGYHYVIERDGNLQRGRPEYWQGAHASPYNKNSLGVCLIGRSQFEPVQFAVLKALISDIRARYPRAAIIAHNELNSKKSCPGFDLAAWLSKEGIGR